MDAAIPATPEPTTNAFCFIVVEQLECLKVHYFLNKRFSSILASFSFMS